jgi:hypothetical protein
MFKSKYKLIMTDNVFDLDRIGVIFLVIGMEEIIDTWLSPLILGTYCDCNTLKVILYAVIACLGLACMGIAYRRIKKEKI